MNEKFINELSKYLNKELFELSNSENNRIKELLIEYNKQGYSPCEDCEREYIDPWD